MHFVFFVFAGTTWFQRDLRLQAVRLLMHLEESTPKRQTELAEELGMEGYAMSRLLAKLELHRYITRQRERTDKIVSLWKK
jgi:DNA-binding MarR family transcriptional regulator